MYQGIGLEQSPQITLTPEMRQGIEIVAMSAQELGEYLKNRLGDNPFLMAADESACDGPGGLGPSAAGFGPEEGFEGDDGLSGAPVAPPPGQKGWGPDDDWSAAEEHPADRSRARETSSGSFAADEVAARSASPEEGLEVQLYQQMAMELRSAEELTIARHLLASLDEDGYLGIPLERLAQGIPAPVAQVRHVLRVMQVSCEPAGLGARNLAERLAAQLAARGSRNMVAYRLVRSHLEDLAQGRLSHAAAALGVPLPAVKEAYELIRTLEPHPAVRFSSSSTYIQPEVAIIEGPNGYEVSMDDRMLPRVLLNREYAAAMEGQSQARGVSHELVRLLREAEGLMSAVEHRRAVICAMAAAIAEAETPFFQAGMVALRPLTMAEVAQEVGVSESTVSRVANGLYLDTPQGVLEMRFFFHSSVGGDGEGVSSLAVKEAIRQLVEAEDPRHPLSDGQLAEALSGKGMEVSRRTVNKYRSALGILSQSKRRTYGQ